MPKSKNDRGEYDGAALVESCYPSSADRECGIVVGAYEPSHNTMVVIPKCSEMQIYYTNLIEQKLDELKKHTCGGVRSDTVHPEGTGAVNDTTGCWRKSWLITLE